MTQMRKLRRKRLREEQCMLWLLEQRLLQQDEYKDVIINLTTQDLNSSINVHGLKGSLNSYFIADYCNTKKNKTLQSFQYNAAGYSSQTLKSKNNNICFYMTIKYFLIF